MPAGAVADLGFVRRLCASTSSLIPLGAAFLLATSISAFAEPGIPPARASDFIYGGAAVVIILIGLLGLGALSTWLLHRFTSKRGSFVRTTLLFAVGWGIIGVITGVIPMILLAALFGPGGRTM